jgi:Big-like domain-containing protein
MRAHRKFHVFAVMLVGWVLPLSWPSLGSANSNPECITNSTQGPPSVFIDSTTCGLYYVLHNARFELVSSVETEVKIVYGVWLPSGTPKAMVVLFAGGTGKTGLDGDATTHAMTDAGNNFLVRSAQLFAEGGYAAVVISRPSTLDTDDMAIYGAYRLSAAHAQDIAAVIEDVRTNVLAANPRVYFAGTSAGALSAFAQNHLSSAMLLSSPLVTTSNVFYLGQPGEPRLAPSYLKVPGQVLIHDGDVCTASTPATAALFAQSLQSLGKHVTSFEFAATAGFDLTGQIVPPSTDPVDACDALTHHGFLGVEKQAVNRMVKRLDNVSDNIDTQFPGNNMPLAPKTTVTTTVGQPITIQLDTIATDPDGDALTFRLPYLTSSRDATLSLSGATVTFTSSQVGTDGFVYIVKDGKRGKAVGVVVVDVQ